MKTIFQRSLARIMICSFILTIFFLDVPITVMAAGTTPSLEVTIETSPQSLSVGPDLIKYNFIITNTGNKPLSDIIIQDDTCDPITFISGDSNNNTKLDLSETWLYSCSETVSKTQTSTVEATGWDNDLKVSDTTKVIVNVQNPGIAPLIHVIILTSSIKSVDKDTLVTYTEKITNPGNADLENIRIYDDECSPMEYSSGDKDFDSRIDTSETWIFNCQTYLTKTTTNIVTVNGEANGLFVESKAGTTVTVRNNKILTDTETYTIPTFLAASVVTPNIPKLPRAGIPPEKTNK